MNKTRVSKAYRGKDHIGWKKTVAGRNWFLCYGTSPSDEARAIAIATALEAKWQLVKLAGGSELTQTDFEEARDLALGRSSLLPSNSFPNHAAAIVPHPVVVGADAPKSDGPVRRWLHAAIDEFVSSVIRAMKPDMSNGDHVVNTRDRTNTPEQIVFAANDRADQENLIEQLKNRVRSMRNPLDNLHSNWAYMVTASLAWTLKAFWGLMLPAKTGRWRTHQEQQKHDLVKMEFKRFVNNLICLPCQIIKTGRRLVYRLLSYNPWQSALLRGVVAWRTRAQC